MKKRQTIVRDKTTNKLFVIQETPQQLEARQAKELAEEQQSDAEHMKTCPHCKTDEDIYRCYLQRAIIKAFQMGHTKEDVLKEVKNLWNGFV
jgi:hypothetical protein